MAFSREIKKLAPAVTDANFLKLLDSDGKSNYSLLSLTLAGSTGTPGPMVEEMVIFLI